MTQPIKFPPENLTVLAHFYRGEIYRSSVWRTRLDVTTNWAILSVTATFSWSFGGSVQSHIVYPLTTLIVLLLLGIETRRYRYYDVWWTRARMLEAHLLVPALNPELTIKQGNWREVLSNDLLLPSFRISFAEAFARRLTHNYIWLFLFLFFGWMFRVYTGADANGDHWVTTTEFYLRCGYEFIHPNVIIGFEFGFTGAILLLLLANWRGRLAAGEIRRRDASAPTWPI